MSMSHQCLGCRHKKGVKDIYAVFVENPKYAAATCDAFPDGIPSEIFRGEFIHNKPYPGDNGILYERRDD